MQNTNDYLHAENTERFKLQAGSPKLQAPSPKPEVPSSKPEVSSLTNKPKKYYQK